MADVPFRADTFGDFNRALCEQAALAMVLVGEMRAIEPMYGSSAQRFCWIEAGAILQLLGERASRFGVGMCVSGMVDEKHARHAFELHTGQEVLCSALCGAL